jgi:hypothetical protein
MTAEIQKEGHLASATWDPVWLPRKDIHTTQWWCENHGHPDSKHHDATCRDLAPSNMTTAILADVFWDHKTPHNLSSTSSIWFKL